MTPFPARARAAGIIVMLGLAAAPARADFKSADWRLYREVTAPAPGPNGFVGLMLDVTAYSGANADLGDLRLVAPGGAEIPYVLLVRRIKITTNTYRPAIINRAVVPGKYQELVLDFGEDGIKQNRIELNVPDRNFRRAVTVYGSDDARQWKLMQSGIHIFDFSGDVHVRELTLNYPANIFRYLKIQIELGPKESPLNVLGAAVTFTVVQPGIDQHYPAVSIAAHANPKLKATDFTVDLGGTKIPVHSLILDVKDPEFYRRVTVYDQRFKQPLGGGVIYRYTAGGYTGEDLRLDISETRLGKFGLRVVNNDNPPLDFAGLQAEGVSRILVFRPPAQGKARLFYGNPRTKPPQYDLAALFSRVGNDSPPLAAFGPVVHNNDYAPPTTLAPPPKPRDWSWLIWLAIIPAAAFLALLIYRSAREINAGENRND